MDNKAETLDILEQWAQELMRERFRLRDLHRDELAIAKAKIETKHKIYEIKSRMNYELDKNGKHIIREIQGEEDEPEEDNKAV